MAINDQTERFSLKDHLFNRKKVTYLAELLAAADPQFNAHQFVKEVMAQMLELELKARIVWIAQVLERHLPSDPNDAMKLIVSALPPPLDPSKTDDDFGDFIFAPFGEYVVRNGAHKKYLKQSLRTIEELTMRFSMEDAIRTFLNSFKAETLAVCRKWTRHHNYHVRRLVSEGTRPLLPWSKRVSLTSDDTLPLLDQLYSDNTRYVTRSVANHLNDISKSDPTLVLTTLLRWQKENRQDPKELEWMTKHALRTLIKRGNRETMAFLGYDSEVKISIEQFVLTAPRQKISRGDTIEFSFVISAIGDAGLLIDYCIDFMKHNGVAKPKVFKLKKLSLKNGEAAVVKKTHLLKADSTTFKLYPGEHALSILINGRVIARESFMLH